MSVVAAGIGLIRRFLKSSGDEREQYKWLAYSVTLLILSLPFAAAFNWSDIAGFIFSIALLSLPVSVAIAVLKYRLYDIDVLINRTLVYVPLTAILAGLYVASTTLIRSLFTDLTDAGSDAAVAASTIAVVALLTPLKNKLQALADSHFKEGQSPAQAIKKLVSEACTVVQVIDTEAFLQAHLSAIATALGARSGALELGYGGESQRFTYGPEIDQPAIVLPLRRNGEELGRLELGPRDNGRPYEQAEREALQESAELLGHIASLNPTHERHVLI